MTRSEAPPASEAGPVVTTQGRLAVIDLMRAVAVSVVVLMHSGLTFLPGDGGVVLFFVVSGYIITALLIRERQRTHRFDIVRFYRRRVLKLGPPLLVTVVVPSLVYATVRPLDLSALAAQIGFTYNWSEVADPGVTDRILPGSEVVWSLAIEEQFYIGFALLWAALLVLGRWRPALLTIALGVAAASLATRVALLATDPVGGLPHATRGTDGRVEAIALGVAVAVLLANDRPSPLALRARRLGGHDTTLVCAVVLFLAASLLFRGGWVEPAFRPTAQALAAAGLIGWALLPGEGVLRSAVSRIAVSRPAQAVGLGSYSIYLAHYPVVKGVDALLGAGVPDVVVLLLNVGLGMAAGLLVYRLVEVPTMGWRDRRRW
ncbi:acyltransferase family protein [Nocardioides acrostichi]|uniref:Acyltransferase n=1 Tax=Nocardioides acrostichi TaxID=2784339 RepID=A0A930UX81_9ACTN|nr:acyltransferase [Nocardioides acrostichi]MBF4162538.1 acyltransferase [Nocardioides acrostichi]